MHAKLLVELGVGVGSRLAFIFLVVTSLSAQKAPNRCRKP